MLTVAAACPALNPSLGRALCSCSSPSKAHTGAGCAQHHGHSCPSLWIARQSSSFLVGTGAPPAALKKWIGSNPLFFLHVSGFSKQNMIIMYSKCIFPSIWFSPLKLHRLWAFSICSFNPGADLSPEAETWVSFTFSSFTHLYWGENCHKGKINNLSCYLPRQVQQNRCEDEQLTAPIRIPKTWMEMRNEFQSSPVCGSTLTWTPEVCEDAGLETLCLSLSL